MVTNLIFIGCAVVVMYVSRVFFDAFVLHKRLRIAFNKKLLGVSFFTNVIALMIVSIAAMPLVDYAWAIFLIQILVIMGVETPLYQIYYRTKLWYELCINLLLARFVFAVIVMVIGIFIMKFVAL